MAAALEVWNETELRAELLRIAASGTSGKPEEFYARAWALISRLRAGREPEYYLARVITECCRPRWARQGIGLQVWHPPIEGHPVDDEQPPPVQPRVARKGEIDD